MDSLNSLKRHWMHSILYLEAEKLNPTHLIVPWTKPSSEFFGTGFGFGGPLTVKAYIIKN